MTTLPPRASEMLAKLEAIITDYVETGVAILEQDYTDKEDVGLLAAQPIKTSLRRIAKDMKRPFIFALTTRWHPWEQHKTNGRYCRNVDKTAWSSHLRLPRRKRFEPIIAALYLVSTDRKTYWANRDDAGVSHWNGKTYIDFAFHGREGFEVFSTFISQCRTDPTFRACLKVPPPVTPEVTNGSTGANHPDPN